MAWPSCSRARAVLALAVCGLLFHGLATMCMFDLYFRSPVVHGMAPHASTHTPPARRLVLFVGDGLRADKFFERQYETPFLRGVLEAEGAFGVCHTHVPTESRPGHVALISGFYEDVSAVTTGWKENPVTFDSLFNESRHTWSWGSPDILPMFARGHEDHIYMDMYSPEFEDFGGDGSNLDTWVFDKVEEFFDQAKNDRELFAKLQEEKIVFFLHLLGTDTIGHSKRPYSDAYLKNIVHVDKGVRKVVEIINNFYKDDKTAFIFASDHGMSDKGNHGDGELANTETPLVVWGAGLRKPQYADRMPSDWPRDVPWTIPSPLSWKLNHLRRVDVEQAAVAPLMAALIGAPFPLNSVGILPVEYLAFSEDALAASLLANLKQIMALTRRYHELKQETKLYFAPANLFVNEELEIRFSEVTRALASEDHKNAVKLSQALIGDCIAAQKYYQTYDRVFLFCVTALGYVGWIVYVLTHLLKRFSYLGRSDLPERAKSSVWAAALTVFGLVSIFLYLERSPIQYYFYVAMPVFFWFYIIDKRHLWAALIGDASQSALKVTVSTVVSTIVLQELQVAGFFFREVFSVCVALLGCGGLFLHVDISRPLLLSWVLSTWTLAIFPLLPIASATSTPFVCVLLLTLYLLLMFSVFGAFLLTALTLLLLAPEIRGRFVASTSTTASVLGRQQLLLAMIGAAAVDVWLTESSLSADLGLPLANQIASWFLLGASVTLLFTLPPNVQYYDAFTTIALALGVPFVLLSISYEVLFYCALLVTLLSWIAMESSLQLKSDLIIRDKSFRVTDTPHRAMDLSDARCILFYGLFCWLAFFGTGNVVSISSFQISSCYRFVTVFQPFLMSAILILKLFIPFALVSVAFSSIVQIRQTPLTGGFYGIVAVTDVMSLTFFFFVKDEGSWKEIGMSIGHFVGVNAFIVIHILLFGFALLVLRRGIVIDCQVREKSQ